MIRRMVLYLSNSHYDICIIGAGPAGLAAAIESSRRGLSCLLLDRNKKPGKKLYATGNGRCNLCNEHYDRDCYYGSDFASEIIYMRNLRDFVTEYMDGLGIKTVSKNGYYYPLSEKLVIQNGNSGVWSIIGEFDPGTTYNWNKNYSMNEIVNHIQKIFQKHKTYSI